MNTSTQCPLIEIPLTEKTKYSCRKGTKSKTYKDSKESLCWHKKPLKKRKHLVQFQKNNQVVDRRKKSLKSVSMES